LRDKLYRTTLALAGILQAVSLVRELAQLGKTQTAAFDASIASIFYFDAPDLETVFSGRENLRIGLENLIKLFSSKAAPSQTRYLLALISLEKKMARSPKMLELFRHRLLQAQKQVEYFSLTHPTVLANLADLYLTALKTFNFRLVIWGSQRMLSAPMNMEKIRALLLAGLRATVLWRQMGGSRWQLIFYRSQIKAMAEKILTELGPTL
jgi:high frequency lysogenization protein